MKITYIELVCGTANHILGLQSYKDIDMYDYDINIQKSNDEKKKFCNEKVLPSNTELVISFGTFHYFNTPIKEIEITINTGTGSRLDVTKQIAMQYISISKKYGTKYHSVNDIVLHTIEIKNNKYTVEYDS